eukprot:5896385-Pyramimonas_sp.AAC.1
MVEPIIERPVGSSGEERLVPVKHAYYHLVLADADELVERIVERQVCDAAAVPGEHAHAATGHGVPQVDVALDAVRHAHVVRVAVLQTVDAHVVHVDQVLRLPGLWARQLRDIIRLVRRENKILYPRFLRLMGPS